MQYPMIAQPQYAFAPTDPMMGFKEGGSIAAENVRSQGRYGDSMLVHMSPNEVAGLQALAMQHGGSLTINPKTGLPEAFFLSALLPMLAGAAAPTLTAGTALAPLFATPLMTGLTIGGLTALFTGDINKGLSAGFGASGGAGLAKGLSAAGASAAPADAIKGLDLTPAVQLPSAVPGQVGDVSLASSYTGPSQGVTAITPTTPTTPAAPAPSGFSQMAEGAKRLVSGDKDAFGRFIGDPANAKTGAPATGLGGAMGAISTAGSLATPFITQQPTSKRKKPEDEKSTYEGPYFPTERTVLSPTEEDLRRLGTSEFTYFTPSNPVPGFQPYRAAKGGSVPQLENGGFVLTKKAIDGLGNGSNDKGQQVASRGLGAIPIRGKGTGTSDSIKTSIDGKYPARISNGEAYVPRKEVKRRGGANKFYALMKKAERAAR